MSLKLNLRNLEKKPIHLQGGVTAEELELADVDELLQMALPLQYDLVAQMMDDSILVQGTLETVLTCQCGRCLKSFQRPLKLENWALHLPLEGEDKPPIQDDCVDLTPYLREDILLTLPQRPLCEIECSGLSKGPLIEPKQSSGASQDEVASSAWAELNKLKFEKE